MASEADTEGPAGADLRAPSVANLYSARYGVFISYSHRDKRWAEWLYTGLEDFTLAGRLSRDPYGTHQARSVGPVFRDRERLAASADLTKELVDALEGAAYLVVICSPTAAASHWVNKEILHFKLLGRSSRILSFIVDGEPNAASNPTSVRPECFPEALRYKPTSDVSGEPEERHMIAADARAHADGKDLALSKLLAGLLEGDVKAIHSQRQSIELATERRKFRQAAAIGGIATGLAATALFAMLFAVNRSQAADEARLEAQQRSAALEGLLANSLDRTIRLRTQYALPVEVVRDMLVDDAAGLARLAAGSHASLDFRLAVIDRLIETSAFFADEGADWRLARERLDDADKQLDALGDVPDQAEKIALRRVRVALAEAELEMRAGDPVAANALLDSVSASLGNVGADNTATIAGEFAYLRGQVLALAGEFADARAELDKACAFFASQRSDGGAGYHQPQKLARCLFERAETSATVDDSSSLNDLQAAKDLQMRLLQDAPDSVPRQLDLVAINQRIGAAESRLNRPDNAASAYRAAIEMALALRAADPRNAEARARAAIVKIQRAQHAMPTSLDGTPPPDDVHELRQASEELDNLVTEVGLANAKLEWRLANIQALQMLTDARLDGSKESRIGNARKAIERIASLPDAYKTAYAPVAEDLQKEIAALSSGEP